MPTVKHDEVIDLVSDSESDTIRMSRPTAPPRQKRKATGLSQDDRNEDETIDVRPPKKTRQSSQSTLAAFRSRQSAISTSSVSKLVQSDQAARPLTDGRQALRELDSSEFANKVRGPVAFCQRPIYGEAFKSKYTSVPSPAAPPFAPEAGAAASVLQTSATTTIGRPRRQATLLSYNFGTPIDSDSEADAAKTPNRAVSRRKRSPRADESDVDFNMSGEQSSANEAESDHNASGDGTSIEPDDESEESDVGRPSNKHAVERKPRSVKTTSSVRKASKAVSAAELDAGKIKNLTSIQNRKGSQPKGVDLSLPPLSETSDIFRDLTKRALKEGLDKAVKHLQGRPLRIATMCSGTESPLLALEEIKDALQELSPNTKLEVQHLFSAEIVPFKQAYIERNFNPPILFRDITEMTAALNSPDGAVPMATTAYGSKVPIPQDIDIVIAGTSCVDFSALNSHKKGLHGSGESADTWKAVKAFCKAFRPSIVLLENVYLAKWATMLSDYEEIGYSSCAALVDTKDYYLPQTRQRGYMACFDNSKLSAAGVNPDDTMKTWRGLMMKMKRFASVPASTYLIPNDRISRQHLRMDEPMKDHDWSLSQMRAIVYRETQKLGSSRPVTNWSESGSMLIPDNGHAAWYHKQVERVLDVIDLATLRKALPSNGMYDASYKTRLWDLSQNIDRDGDKRPFGIIGCITPSGQYFASDAGRELIHVELLRLQGMPLDRISFTTETSAEVQDLAGNAMSTPVIASAIISAIIPGYKILGQRSAESPTLLRETTSGCTDPRGTDMQRQSVVTQAEHIDMIQMCRRAEDAMRRCYCEGSEGLASRPIQECIECGHTTCTSCGGNPEHKYRSKIVLNGTRLAPSAFKTELQSTLPLRLTWKAALPKEVFGSQHSSYTELISSSLDAVFSFRNIRRTSHWTAIYRGDGEVHAELHLVLGQNEPQWLLHVRASPSLPGNDPLRGLLQAPVARASAATAFLGRQWEVRLPRTSPRSITIKCSGGKIASWWCRNGMPDFSEHYLWETLEVEFPSHEQEPLARLLAGRYQYLPKCGTACSGLYKRVDTEMGDRPVYLFLDPSPIGDPKDDCFVFAEDVSRKEYDEVRQIFARIVPSWRPWSVDGTHSACDMFTKTTLIADEWRALPPAHQLTTVPLRLAMDRPKDMTKITTESGCSKAVCLLSCSLPHDASWKGEDGVDRNLQSSHAWILEAMRRHLVLEDWTSIPDGLIKHDCKTCVPARPSLRWSLGENGSIVPYEDPSTAAAYERAIKSRPKVLKVSTERRQNQLAVTLVGNLASLAERAGAKLPDGVKPEHHWRLVSNVQRITFAFRPFSLKATTEIVPYEQDLGLSVELFPKQKLALAWMRNQETGIRFRLEQIEEESIASSGWRLEVKAQTDIEVRGGIAADHPGFGKTITSLALIKSQLLEQSSGQIVADLATRQCLTAPGLIPLAATLVICPFTLLKQWVEEANAKLGYKAKEILAIRTVADLSKLNFADFQSAKIVFVSRSLLANDAYTERLAAFAAVPGPATKSGRSFTQWLNFAQDQVPAHLAMLRTQSSAAFKKHIETAYKSNIESDRFSKFVPSRRLRGAGYVAAKEKQKQPAATNLKAASTVDTTNIRSPLLEHFFFNRLIVDEFHQYEAKEYSAIKNLKADKRWGLSGTPALDDFYDLAQIGGLLGVPLRIGSDAKGVMKAKNARELKKDMTNFELFDSMRQLPSDATYASIHDHDQLFLDTFVRQNIMDFDDLVFHEHLVPVNLELDHHAMYLELSQQLNSMDMRIRKGSKAKSSREHRASAAVNASETAEEALSRFAADFEEDCRHAIDERDEESERILSNLPGAIADARVNEAESFDQWKMSQLHKGALGDASTIAKILKIVNGPSQLANGFSKPKTPEKGEKKGKMVCTSTLNDMCKRLIVVERSARYLRNVQGLYAASRTGDVVSACDVPGCSNPGSSKPDAAISALCGHFVCRVCYEKLVYQNKPMCQVQGCRSTLSEFQLLWTEKLCALKETTAASHGAKMDAAVHLLRKIEKQGDQAILFVQYESQLRDVGVALKANGIKATVVEDNTAAAGQIADFRETSGTSKQKTVIVLNASSETAAGSNLQCANNVIFLSPLLRDTQYGYDSTMAQAIGRVRRHGQKKEIHVYRIVALNTIDVDILEHREKRNAALTEEGDIVDAPPAAKQLDMSEKPAPERTQLVCQDGRFSLRPRSWIVKCGADEGDVSKMMGKNRVLGWEDFSSLVKFSGAFTENDD